MLMWNNDLRLQHLWDALKEYAYRGCCQTCTHAHASEKIFCLHTQTRFLCNGFALNIIGNCDYTDTVSTIALLHRVWGIEIPIAGPQPSCFWPKPHVLHNQDCIGGRPKQVSNIKYQPDKFYKVQTGLELSQGSNYFQKVTSANQVHGNCIWVLHWNFGHAPFIVTVCLINHSAALVYQLRWSYSHVLC